MKHSIHVYERLREMFSNELERNTDGPVILSDEDEEKIAICGLLHDICKVNFYDVEMRNRKNERGQWEKYPYYVVNDQLPYGHGEKSVYIISGFMKLTREETWRSAGTWALATTTLRPVASRLATLSRSFLWHF